MLILMPLVAFQISFGQENKNENTNPKFGLGVSLFNIVEYTYEQPNSIYVTINIGNKFRLEPKVGIALSDEADYSFGIGAFGIKPVEKFNVLYGVRLGYSSSAIAMISPTIGGEYYFIKNFSLGSEVQLQGVFDEGFALLTNSAVIVRFYF